MSNSLKVSDDKVHLIREEKLRSGEVITVDAWMPVGRGYNEGNPGAIDWMNKSAGWRSYDEYMAEKNHKQAEAKRLEAEKAKADADAKAEKKK